MSGQQKDEITLVQAAHVAGTSYQQAYGMVLKRQLEGRQDGRQWFVKRASAEAVAEMRQRVLDAIAPNTKDPLAVMKSVHRSGGVETAAFLTKPNDRRGAKKR